MHTMGKCTVLESGHLKLQNKKNTHTSQSLRLHLGKGRGGGVSGGKKKKRPNFKRLVQIDKLRFQHSVFLKIIVEGLNSSDMYHNYQFGLPFVI